MRKLDAAIRSYQKAIEREPGNGFWWYRLGRLQLDAGRPSEAGGAFEQATRIGDQQKERSFWLPDAHRLLADVLRVKGNRNAAIAEYRTFLDIASEGAIDRKEVKKILLRWGIDVDKKAEEFE
jgi:tetratricopeptide (TPR) repeat protein